MNEDFVDILAALLASEARFLVVGAHAMAVHGVPRATGDLDILLEATPENAQYAWHALLRFGAPVASIGVSPADLATPGMVIQIGLPPRRIDLLTRITGVGFDEAWSSHIEHRVGNLSVPFIGRDCLLRNKTATGRPKDLADIAALTDGGG